MSFVSGVVLCTSCVEEDGSQGEDGTPLLFEQINEWLAEQARGVRWALAMVENHFGGGKHPQMLVAGGGFNYFCEDEFADYVLRLPWRRPENVVLIIQPEDGGTRVFRGRVPESPQNQ